ncbi:DEAD-domain-containing protein [Athelia psychrophila]|uniref:RNA helicase n=1 Tax=Athelia psychrophila TaxID=1759441 RepID=A0A166TAH2_9AGAM|nr:DEAD-domain-containing protein [Fibularhizoctonia sp. CBS 109695]
MEAVDAERESHAATPRATTHDPIAQPDKSEKKKKKRKRDAEEQVVPAIEQDASPAKKDKKTKQKSHSAAADTPTQASNGGASTPSTSEIDAFLTKHSITIHAPPSQTGPSPAPIISFSQLTSDILPAELSSAFKGFKEPTPVQACTWQPALQGQDVVGIAETGSGKTLAFGIPALARLIASPPDNVSGKAKGKAAPTVTVLVVAPTRELALQTHDTLSALGAPFGIASVAIFGGVDKGPQIKSLSNANKDGKITRIVVGTPGRILDLVNDGICDLSRVNYLVLDEADRMLDSGFENDIRNIISHTKPLAERQTMMFSATWPEAVRRLASTFQRDPVRVTVGSDDLTANSRVEQSVEVFDDNRSKDSRLLDRLRQLSHKKTTTTGSTEARILVFALYKKEASRVEDMLRRQGYAVGALHGDLSQSARMDALDKFKNGTTGLLVATDVAARGLDIPNVGAVINYTFPLTIEDYIHRIGRTGRGGKTGKSITFFTGDAHERSLAGEFARVLRESGFDSAAESLGEKFPMTIKKKTHGAYGAFFRDDIPVPKGPTKIVF